MLILYLAILMNSFVSSSSFCVKSVGFSTYHISYAIVSLYLYHLFILFLAALDLCCCAPTFSSCGEQGLLSSSIDFPWNKYSSRFTLP